MGALVGDAARVAGIDHDTMYDWIRQGKAGKSPAHIAFSDMVRKARSEVKLGAVGSILLAGKKDWRAMQYFLTVTDPKHYAPTVRHHIESEQSAFLATLERKLTPELFRKVLEEYVAEGGSAEAPGAEPGGEHFDS